MTQDGGVRGRQGRPRDKHRRETMSKALQAHAVCLEEEDTTQRPLYRQGLRCEPRGCVKLQTALTCTGKEPWCSSLPPHRRATSALRAVTERGEGYLNTSAQRQDNRSQNSAAMATQGLKGGGKERVDDSWVEHSMDVIPLLRTSHLKLRNCPAGASGVDCSSACGPGHGAIPGPHMPGFLA